MFHTPAGQAFVEIRVKGHRETYPISSKAFGHWLSLQRYEFTGKPSPAELKRQAGMLEAKAVQPDTPEREVHLRTAFADGRAYLDLCDSTWRAVRSGRMAGGSLITHLSGLFVSPACRPCPMPEEGGSIAILRSLFERPAMRPTLFSFAWLLDALHDEGGHPPLVSAAPRAPPNQR